jgi:hypothetical protein
MEKVLLVIPFQQFCVIRVKAHGCIPRSDLGFFHSASDGSRQTTNRRSPQIRSGSVSAASTKHVGTYL